MKSKTKEEEEVSYPFFQSFKKSKNKANIKDIRANQRKSDQISNFQINQVQIQRVNQKRVEFKILRKKKLFSNQKFSNRKIQDSRFKILFLFPSIPKKKKK